MGLDLWFREDVARILAATYEVMVSSQGALPPASGDDQQLAGAYRRGFVDALRAVAVAFGVAAPSAPADPTNGDGYSRQLASGPGRRSWPGEG